MVDIPVGAWRPDLPDYERQGSCEALNVIPGLNSYRPFPAYVSTTDALTARGQGAFFARASDGSGFLFAGDATKLYKLVNNAWTDVSRLAGGVYATPADGVWNFELFGSTVYAQNGLDTPQKFNIDTDANFTDGVATMPTSKYLGNVGDFLMLGNIGAFRNRIQWSPIDDPDGVWTPSQVTQASRQDLPDGGWVQGLVGLEFAAVILQEFAIRRCTYVGVPLIFQFAEVAKSIGCTIPGSVAAYKDLIFFVHRTGFYSIVGGYQIAAIGEQKWNRYFWNNIDVTNLHRVTSAIDPANTIYLCMFPNLSASAGNPNEGIAYNWTTGEGSHIMPGDFEMVFSGATQTAGYTLEGLDAISLTLEGLPFSLDSQFYSGVARQLLSGFGTDHKMGFFDGSPLAYTVDTTEAEIIKSRKSFLRSGRPLVDGGTPSITLGTRDRLIDAVTWGTPTPIDSLGYCAFRRKARYYRGRITGAAGDSWTHIQGIDDITARSLGTR